MPLTDIATIVVSTTAAGVTRPGFGVPLILGYGASWSDRIRFYSNIAAVAGDGFAVNSPEYLAANEVFEQNTTITQLAIGRGALIPQQTISVGVASGIAAAINTPYDLRVAVPTGVVFPSQDALYQSAGATPWTPSGIWRRGDLVVNPVNTIVGTGFLWSCLGPSGAGTSAGFTGYGSASGPTGGLGNQQDGQVFWMYAGAGNTGNITNDAVINGLKATVELLGSPTAVGTGANQLLSTLQGSAGARTLQLQAVTAGKFFGFQARDRGRLQTTSSTADAGVVADLNAIQNANPNWYGLIKCFESPAISEAAAAWTESNTKLHGAQTQDWSVPSVAQSSASDVGTSIQNSAYARTWVFYHPSNDEFAVAAQMGRFLSVNPGGETWRMKTLAGITAQNYTGTEETNLLAKASQFYYSLGGVPVVGGAATTGSGEYIDITRFLDWYTANLQADLADLAISLNKIPYTNPGIDLIEAKVTARNKAGIAAGGIALGTDNVTAPDVANVSTSDKQARQLNGVLSTFTLAGAIHHITVNVTASQ